MTLTRSELARLLDHSVLKPEAVEADVQSGAEGGAQGFLAWLRDLKKTIGIAPSLSAVGVRKDAIPRLVEIAVADICHQTNPQPVTAKDFERLFAEAM